MRRPPSPIAWRLHAWGERALEERMIDDGVVAIGGHELGDLAYGPTLEDLRAELRERFPDRNERAIGVFVGYWRAFLYDMAVGDLVALSLSGGRAAIGRVVGGYIYRPLEPDQARHARPIDWLVADLPRARFDDDIKATLNSRGTICRIGTRGAVHRLETAAAVGSDPGRTG